MRLALILVIFVGCGNEVNQPVDMGVVDALLPSDVSLDAFVGISIEDASPEEICNEMLRLMLEKGSRCYDEDKFPEYIEEITEYLSCHTVVEIRSRRDLFHRCLPTIMRRTCNQFIHDPLPITCFGLFIKEDT